MRHVLSRRTIDDQDRAHFAFVRTLECGHARTDAVGEIEQILGSASPQAVPCGECFIRELFPSGHPLAVPPPAKAQAQR
jgi:hypothetical protein